MKDYINLMAGWNVRLVSICNAKRRGDCRSYKAGMKNICCVNDKIE